MNLPYDSKMKTYNAISVPPPQSTNNVFRVRDIAERTRCNGRPHYAAVLAKRTNRHDAIAGPVAVTLTTGNVIHVYGCVLLRRGAPLLVICSLEPVILTRRDWRIRNGSEDSFA
jgi:hypothetical protein